LFVKAIKLFCEKISNKLSRFLLLFIKFVKGSTFSVLQEPMKIFSAAQIKACDAYTIHASSISSQELVERAATACTAYIVKNYPPDTPFVLLCGMGNNGADGLAIARFLLQSGFSVKVFLLQHSGESTPENQTNINKLLRIDASLLDYIVPDTFIADLPEQVVIIDAILGTGLTRPAEDWLADFLKHINHFPNRKIAIDIPSGMPADTIPATDSAMIHADETLSFQFYKRSFLHPETGSLCGNIHLLDIGLHSTFIEATHTHYQTIDLELVAYYRKKKDEFSYKNIHGHALVAAGSFGKAGAAVMSTMSALRSGVGLVTSLVPECCYDIIQATAPESMCAVSGLKFLEDISDYDNVTAIGIGSGTNTKEDTVKGFIAFMDDCKLPCVFDADALNILAMHKELMNKIPPNSILTPHLGECKRLFGDSINSMQMVENIRMQAMRYKTCIVLKGHHTVVASPDGDCYYNLTGNAGMAKAGSGDVLTGLLTGLLAQGYDAMQAALLGVYLHGLSGDIAAAKLGQEAMTAKDLIFHFSDAWQKLGKS
jgi:ADP-dependent NAD(P)H-hydrate dehydratase / NAD(P)H-hydrate epimerase